MKIENFAFTMGIVATLLAVALSFVSSTNYFFIFIAILMLDGFAILSFGYLALAKKGWRIRVVFPSLLVVYTLFDIALRYLWSMRVLEVV